MLNFGWHENGVPNRLAHPDLHLSFVAKPFTCSEIRNKDFSSMP
jgi:hypothetical protein